MAHGKLLVIKKNNLPVNHYYFSHLISSFSSFFHKDQQQFQDHKGSYYWQPSLAPFSSGTRAIRTRNTGTRNDGTWNTRGTTEQRGNNGTPTE